MFVPCSGTPSPGTKKKVCGASFSARKRLEMLSANSRQFKARLGCASATAECCAGLSLLFLDYFWIGQTSRRAVVGIAERTLSAVFKQSGVKNAHAHRYRHTLATNLLARGA